MNDEESKIIEDMSRIYDRMLERMGKEKTCEKSLKALESIDIPSLVGGLYVGLKMLEWDDAEIAEALVAVNGMIEASKDALKDNAYEFKIQEDD